MESTINTILVSACYDAPGVHDCYSPDTTSLVLEEEGETTFLVALNKADTICYTLSVICFATLSKGEGTLRLLLE
jgi:hypothetical protein